MISITFTRRNSHKVHSISFSYTYIYIYFFKKSESVLVSFSLFILFLIHHSCDINLSLRHPVTCEVSEKDVVLSGLQDDYDKLVSHPRCIRHESTVSHFFLDAARRFLLLSFFVSFSYVYVIDGRHELFRHKKLKV
jgi:hypothetical protein